MAIKYYILPYPVSSDPDAHYARVAPHRSLDEEAIAQDMVNRGTSFSKADILGVLQLLTDSIRFQVSQGNRVNLALARFGPVVKGRFNSRDDHFDDDRYALRVQVQSGSRLQTALKAAEVEKIARPLPKPVVLEFTDVASQQVNARITPANMGIVTGRNLLFDPSQADEGLFFIDSAGAATRVVIMPIPPGKRSTF